MKKLLVFFACLNACLLNGAEAAAPAHAQSSYLQTIIMIAVFVLVFYFLLWRPDRKKRKEMEQKRSTMKKGDKVTAMGIIGTVFKIQDSTVILKMYDGAKIEILKAAITDIQPATDTEEEAKPEETSSS